MSSAALIGLLAGLAFVGLAMLLIVRGDRSVPGQGDAIGSDEERTYWQQKVDEASLDFGLAGTRAAAGKWGASAAAILGVLGTAAIVAGPKDLAKDVGGTEAQVAAVLVLVAGGLAAIATLLAGLAEQGSPVSATGMTPEVLRRLTRERAHRAAGQIRWSRILTAVSLCFILAATGVAWLAALTGKDDPATQSAVVVDTSGAKCGTLVKVAQGLSLKVGDKTEPVPADARITLVDTCPG